MFGNPETTTGGNVFKILCICQTRYQKINSVERFIWKCIGNKTRVKVVKNKVAPPFRYVNLILCMVKISKTGEILDIGTNRIIIKVVHGLAMVTLNLVKVDSVKNLLKDNPNQQELEKKISEVLNSDKG